MASSQIFISIAFLVMVVSAIAAPDETSSGTDLLNPGRFFPLPMLASMGPFNIQTLNQTMTELSQNLTRLPDSLVASGSALMANVTEQLEAIQKQILPADVLDTGNAMVANITEKLPSIQFETLMATLYNHSHAPIDAGATVLTEGLARPLTFFVGQNLRLLGSGLWSVGHSLKHSGYHISNLEPVIQNASQALSEYGLNLVNASMNTTAIANHTNV